MQVMKCNAGNKQDAKIYGKTVICNLRGVYMINLPQHFCGRAFVWCWDQLHKDSEAQEGPWCLGDNIARKTTKLE